MSITHWVSLINQIFSNNKNLILEYLSSTLIQSVQKFLKERSNLVLNNKKMTHKSLPEIDYSKDTIRQFEKHSNTTVFYKRHTTIVCSGPLL